MKTILALVLVLAGIADAAISAATKPHTIDSAVTPKVSYVDDNDEALLDKLNEVIDTANTYLGGGVSAAVLSTTADQRLTIDSDNNGSNRWFVTSGGTSDTLLRILEGGAWATYGAGTGTKLTLSDSILAATARISGNGYFGGTLTAVGATSLAGLSATTGAFSSNVTVGGTLGVTGVSTLNNDNLTRSFRFYSTSGAFLDTDSYPAIFASQDVSGSAPFNSNGHLVLQARTGGATGRGIQLFTGTTPTLRLNVDNSGLVAISGNSTVGGTFGVTGVSKFGTGTLTFGSKNLSVIGASFDGTSVQFENTDVNTVANGRAFNFGITDVSGTNGRFDLTQPGERTVFSVFSNGNVGLGSTTDGGEGFQVAGTSRFAGALTASTNFTQSAGTHTVSVTDNTADAVDIQQGSNNYINLTTANGAEVLALGNATTNPAIQLLGSGTKTIDGTINTDLTASRTVVTDGSGNLSVNTETGTGSHVKATSPTLVTPTLGVASATSIALGGGEAFVYGDTSFTMTVSSGMTTTPSGTAYATRIGRMVVLYVPYLSGTSNATEFYISGVPTGWRPARNANLGVRPCSDNSTGDSRYGCHLLLDTGGGIGLLFSGVNTGNFTASGNKSLGDASTSSGVTVTYQLQ